MIDIEKFDDFEKSEELDEMAAGFPIGMVILVDTTENLGKAEEKSVYQRYSSGSKTVLRQEKYRPMQAEGAEDGVFFAKIEISGKKWLFCEFLFGNCLTNPIMPGTQVKVATTDALKPGSVFKILADHEEAIKEMMKKKFYVEGEEPGLTKNDGEKFINFKEGEYFAAGVNFALTEKEEEPVIFMNSSFSGRDNSFSIPLSQLKAGNLLDELNDTQKEVIARDLGKLIGVKVEFSPSSYESSQFRIWRYYVSARKGDKIFHGQWGPYASEEEAKEQLEERKKDKMPLYDKDTLRVEHDSSNRMSLQDIIDYARTNGSEVRMRDLLKKNRGEIKGKSFGV